MFSAWVLTPIRSAKTDHPAFLDVFLWVNFMPKELDLILDYERARREIKILGDEIQKSIHYPFNEQAFYKPKCTEARDNQAPCFERLWDYNTRLISMEPEDHPYDDEKPDLCEFCKITQSLVDQRKAAKKRFGIAKMRISRFASDHIKALEKTDG